MLQGLSGSYFWSGLDASCWSKIEGVRRSDLHQCQLLEKVGDSAPGSGAGTGVCPRKQILGRTGVREVRASVPAVGVGLQVTTHVPGAGCCRGESLYLPQTWSGGEGMHVSTARKPQADLCGKEEALGTGRGIKWEKGI